MLVINHIATSENIFTRNGVCAFELYCLIIFPNNLWFKSQVCSLFELFINSAADSSTNGVVGNPGTTIPIIPNVNEISPSITNSIFINDVNF